jgi:hypothetical protein
MRQLGCINMLFLPPTGGLTGAPSALVLVSQFLAEGSNLSKVNDLAQQATSLGEYRSLIDFLLVELMPEFREACLRFYEGRGKSFIDACSPEERLNVDEQIRNILEILTSREWTSWGYFKRTYRTEMNWEPL